MDGSVARWFLSKLVSRTGLLGLKTSTTYFSRTSIARASVRRISINTDHSIGIYSYPDNLLIIGEGVGRGTLYLYELVGEPYMSMLVWECSFGKMKVGQSTVGQKT